MRFVTNRRLLYASPATIALAVLLAGCGSSHSTSTTAQGTAAPATSTTAKLAAAPPPVLRILAPARGAHTGPTVTVKVRLTGTAPRGSNSFHFLLDNRESRQGSAHLTFNELAPGRHRLLVTLANDVAVRVGSFFVVRAPAPVPAAEPAQVITMATPAAPASGARPEPSPPQPASKPSAPPAASSGIPQGNGGDGDSDNNGGPSDGDGNV